MLGNSSTSPARGEANGRCQGWFGLVAGLLVALLSGCGKKPAPEPAVADAPTAGADAPGSPKTPAPPPERDKLLATLKTKRGEARQQAVDRLAALAASDPAAVDGLVELLRDKTTAGPGTAAAGQLASVREAAAVALLRAGPAGDEAIRDKGLAALRDGLLDKDPAVREHTAHTVGLLGPTAKPLAASVQRLCGDPDAHVREAAYEAVGQIGAADLVGLAGLLNNPNKEVRLRAAEAVGLLAAVPADAVGSLTRALLAEEEPVRVAAANGIAVAGVGSTPRQVGENLAAAVKQSYPDVLDPAGIRLDGPEMAYWRALARIGKPAVDPAAGLLTHKNPAVRMLAARTLGALGAEARPAVEALAKALNDDFANVSLEVACTLANLDEKRAEVDALVQAALASTNPGVASYAIEAVARMGVAGKPHRPQVLDKLGSPLADARYAAVGYVGRLPAAEAAPHLPAVAKLLADAEPLIRGRAAGVLEALGPAAGGVAGAVGARLAAEEDEGVRDGLVDALLAMGPAAKPAVGGLLPLAADAANAPAVRAKVIGLVAAADPASPAVAAVLTTAAGDAKPEVRTAAAAALAQLNPLPDDARAALVRMARSDGSAAVQLAAVRALAAAGPRAKAAKPDLQAIAAGGRPGVDLWAKVAAAAVDGNPAAAAADVRAGLGHKSPVVRAAAAEALAVVGPTAADVPALLKLLREPPAGPKEAAAAALGRIGPAAKDAVPRLAMLLTVKESEVRIAAAEALGRIGPAAVPAAPKLREVVKSDRMAAAAARKALERLGVPADAPGR